MGSFLSSFVSESPILPLPSITDFSAHPIVPTQHMCKSLSFSPSTLPFLLSILVFLLTISRLYHLLCKFNFPLDLFVLPSHNHPLSSILVLHSTFGYLPQVNHSSILGGKICRMGRVKLKIKRLENTNGRQATFAKRKNGILKKATELSILCDIDIILLMFSPSGKPSLCRGLRSSVEEVIEKFAQLTPQERAKRKLEGLEALKKTFRKLDHDVNIQEFLGTSNQTKEDLRNHSRLLQSQISEINNRLSCWTEPDKIDDVEPLVQMENSIRESLNQIRMRKENIQKQQLARLEYSNQFNEMQIPYRMSADQHLPSFSWIPNNDDGQHILLPEDSDLLLQRELECSASSSFGSYASYVGSSTKTEMSSCGQENGVISELTSNAPVRLQFGQFQYGLPPYNYNLLNNTKFQSAVQMNPHENPLDYRVNGSFEAPQPSYDNNHHGWASTSGSSAATLFDEPLYPQQPNWSLQASANDVALELQSCL